MDTRTRAFAIGALALGAVVLGFGPIFVRLTETGPASAGFWRMALALPLMAAFAFRAGAQGPVRPPSRATLGAGLFFALDLAFWHYGIHYTSVANATVLANLTPIVVTFAGWLLFAERPRAAFILGLALGAAGATAMALAHGGEVEPGRNPPLGDALSLITTVWYAAYFLMIRHARQSQGTMAVMFWSSLVGVVVLPAAMLGLGEDMAPSSAAGWGACVGLALIHVFGQGAIAWALGRLPAATAAVVLFVQPVVSAILAWILFSEAVGALQALGGVVALVGVAVAQWAASRADMKKAPAHS